MGLLMINFSYEDNDAENSTQYLTVSRRDRYWDYNFQLLSTTDGQHKVPVFMNSLDWLDKTST